MVALQVEESSPLNYRRNPVILFYNGSRYTSRVEGMEDPRKEKFPYNI